MRANVLRSYRSYTMTECAKNIMNYLIRIENENRLCSRATKSDRWRCSCCHEFIEEHEEPL